MSARLCMVAGALGLAFAGVARADDDLTSPEHKRCLERSGGVTAEMLDCDHAERERQDKRLNAAYRKLLGSASDEQRRALRDAQRLWLAYRATNCALTHTFGEGGTLDLLVASGCEVDVLARRVRFLERLSRDP